MKIPEIVEGYRLPSPPQWKKRDVFDYKRTKDLDEKSKKVTVTPSMTFEELASELTCDLETDLQKVRSLFVWLGKQDFDNEAGLDGLLKLIENKHSPYPEFFARLCRAAQLQCVIIKGNCKAVGYEVGDQTVTAGGTWNAVFVNGSWQIVHPHWAFSAISGYDTGRWTKIEDDGNGIREKHEANKGVSIRRVNEFYFLPHPDEFIYYCMAEKKEWQLLKQPWALHKFCNVPKFDEEYFTSAYKLTSRHEAILFSEDGKCVVEFTQQEETTPALTYKLFFDEEKSAEKLPRDTELPRTVFFETDNNKLRLLVRFHVVGTYKLSISSGRKIAEFRLEAKEKSENENVLPVNPPIGFGFGVTAKTSGINCPSHTGGVVVMTKTRVEVFSFTVVRIADVIVRLRHVKIDSNTLMKFVKKQVEGYKVTIEVRMPDDAKDEEYALQVYMDQERLENNVLNYLLTCRKQDFETQTQPRLPPSEFEVEKLMTELGGWREALLSTDRLLNWTKPYYPVVIISGTTCLFGMMWYYQLPVLTTIALFGLLIQWIYLIVPTAGFLFTTGSEDPNQDKRYEEICRLLMHVCESFNIFHESMVALKTENPKVYQMFISVILVGLACLGRLFNNLLLTYILVTIALLYPGLHRHAVIQKYFREMTDRLSIRRDKIKKKKTN